MALQLLIFPSRAVLDYTPLAGPSIFRSHGQQQMRVVRIQAQSHGSGQVQSFELRSSQGTAVEATEGAVSGGVIAVDKDTFWPIVNAAGEKLVVLDMYTQWCGPCKLIAPKVEELSRTLTDVVFLKLDCNQQNKALAKELGVRVVPTFKLLRDSEVIAEVAGAKYKELLSAIEEATKNVT